MKLAAGILVALAACTHPSAFPTTKVVASDTPCQAAIRAFVSGDPARIRALPTGCTLHDATALRSPFFHTNIGLGTAPGYLTSWSFASAGTERVYAYEVDDQLVMLEVKYPRGSKADYLRVLGDPEGRLNYDEGEESDTEGRRHPESQLVWGSKGVVVIAGPTSTGVERVGVFVPQTVAEFAATRALSDVWIDEAEERD